jgi:hypothetical protein
MIRGCGLDDPKKTTNSDRPDEHAFAWTYGVVPVAQVRRVAMVDGRKTAIDGLACPPYDDAR